MQTIAVDLSLLRLLITHVISVLSTQTFPLIIKTPLDEEPETVFHTLFGRRVDGALDLFASIQPSVQSHQYLP